MNIFNLTILCEKIKCFILQNLNVPVLFCQNEEELPILRDDSVLFVLDEFQTPIFEDLTRDGKRKR